MNSNGLMAWVMFAVLFVSQWLLVTRLLGWLLSFGAKLGTELVLAPFTWLLSWLPRPWARPDEPRYKAELDLVPQDHEVDRGQRAAQSGCVGGAIFLFLGFLTLYEVRVMTGAGSPPPRPPSAIVSTYTTSENRAERPKTPSQALYAAQLEDEGLPWKAREFQNQTILVKAGPDLWEAICNPKLLREKDPKAANLNSVVGSSVELLHDLKQKMTDQGQEPVQNEVRLQISIPIPYDPKTAAVLTRNLQLGMQRLREGPIKRGKSTLTLRVSPTATKAKFEDEKLGTAVTVPARTPVNPAQLELKASNPQH